MCFFENTLILLGKENIIVLNPSIHEKFSPHNGTMTSLKEYEKNLIGVSSLDGTISLINL